MTVYRPAEDKSQPNPVIGYAMVGVLAVWPTDQKVIGVFPQFSSTVLAHSQEIKFFRGDSFNIAVQVQNDGDPPSKVDLGISVLRFAAKQGFGLTNSAGVFVGNEGARIIKTSHDPKQIDVSLGTDGKATIKIKKRDTLDHPIVPFVWDLELTRAVVSVDSPGTVQVLEGSDVIQGTGTNFDVDIGDIIEVQGYLVLVTERIDDTNLQVDFSGWATEGALDYSLYEGSCRTIAFGPWTAQGDVVR